MNPSARKVRSFYPTFIFNTLMIFFLFMGILLTLAILFPFDLQDKADPLAQPQVSKPGWYFLALFQFIKFLPETLGKFVVLVGTIIVLFWPFLDNAASSGFRRRLAFGRWVGWLVVIGTLFLGLLGYLSERQEVIRGKPVQFNYYGFPTSAASSGETDSLDSLQISDQSDEP